MLLISLQPFAPKKLLLLAVTLLCLSASACFADCVYLAGRFAAPAPSTAVRTVAVRPNIAEARASAGVTAPVANAANSTSVFAPFTITLAASADNADQQMLLVTACTGWR